MKQTLLTLFVLFMSVKAWSLNSYQYLLSWNSCMLNAYTSLAPTCKSLHASTPRTESVVQENQTLYYTYCVLPDGHKFSTYPCQLIHDFDSGPPPTNSSLNSYGESTFQRPVCKPGSILNLNERSAGEKINLSGLPFFISYNSARDTARPANRMAELNVTYDPSIDPGETSDLNREVETFLGQESLGVDDLGLSFKVQARKILDLSKFTHTPFMARAEVRFVIRAVFPPLPPTVPGQLPSTEPFKTLANVYEKNIFLYKPEIWGLGSWTLSIHHYYDSENKVIYWGHGTSTPADLPIKNISGLGDVFMGTDEVGSEVYFFDSLGRHLQTRTALMGAPVYQFQYLTDHKLDRILDRDGQITQIIRGSSGEPLAIRSPFGQITSLQIGASGKLEKVQNAIGGTHEIRYAGGGSGLLSQISYPSGLETTFEYDNLGFFVRETKSTGAIQEVFISILDDLSQKIDFLKSNGVSESTLSDKTSAGERSITKDALGNITAHSLFTETKEIRDIGIMTIESTSQPDIRFGSLVRAPSSVFTQIPGLPYNAPFKNAKYTQSVSYTEGTGPFNIAELKTVETVSGMLNGVVVATTEKFDGLEKSLEISTSPSNMQKLYLDERERVTKIERSGSLTTHIQFNTLGQVVEIRQGASSQNFTYDLSGNLIQIADPNGKVTAFERNAHGQIEKETLPNGDSTLFSYSPSGQVKEIRTSNGQVHKFALSPLDQVVSYLAPTLLGSSETLYQHDSFGRLLSITKPSGQRADFAYKAGTDFVERIETPQGNYIFNNLDPQGRPGEIISPDGIRTLITWVGNDLSSIEQYDGNLNIGQIIRSFQFIFKLSYISGNGGAFNVEYGYDSDGRMVKAGSERYSYSLTHAPATATTPERAEKSVTATSDWKYVRSMNNYQTSGESQDGINFNSRSIHSLKWPAFANKDFIIESLADKTHRIVHSKSKIENKPVTQDSYNYDENGRLTSVAGRITAQYTFPPGSNNNIYQYRHGGKITTATYDSQDRLLALKGSIERNFKYSDDGEMIEIFNCLGEKKFEYDFFGHLKKVILPGGKVIEYKLDGLNRRVAKLVNGQVVHYYLWQDQTHLAAVLNPDGSVDTQYVYGINPNAPIYLVKNAQAYPILTNERGDIRLVFNGGSGEIVQSIEYDEYGMVLNDSSITADRPEGFQPLGFASGLYDQDTKLVLFNARSYDPVVGRWTSKDPIGFAGGSPNLYSYTMNDPINFIDPSGLSDINLFPPGQRIYGSDFNIPATPGTFSVGGHGNQNEMVGPNGVPLSPQQVAQMIRNSPGYTGQPVQLNSCSTGGSPNGFAQQLSNNLGVSVTAPSDILGIYTTGETTVYGSGQWNVFQPRPVPFR